SSSTSPGVAPSRSPLVASTLYVGSPVWRTTFLSPGQVDPGDVTAPPPLPALLMVTFSFRRVQNTWVPSAPDGSPPVRQECRPAAPRLGPSRNRYRPSARSRIGMRPAEPEGRAC